MARRRFRACAAERPLRTAVLHRAYQGVRRTARPFSGGAAMTYEGRTGPHAAAACPPRRSVRRGVAGLTVGGADLALSSCVLARPAQAPVDPTPGGAGRRVGVVSLCVWRDGGAPM